MSDGPMLPVVSHELPAPNEPDAAVETLLAELKADGIARVEWTIYWYADQTELQSMALFAADGTHQQTLYDGELLTVWDEALWHLTDMVNPQTSTGTFELVVSERRVAHTGDAWMPDPELEMEPFSPDRVVTHSF